MLRILLLALFVGLSLASFGQTADKVDVKGRVVDEAGEPLGAATIMLLQAVDSVLSNFATTNAKGEFKLAKVKAGDYIMNHCVPRLRQ